MAEENTNKEAFEVVVPEANRVFMDEHEFAEQPDYLVQFANFYVAKFGSDDLELIDFVDDRTNTVDINTYLLSNISFSRKELVKHVLEVHAAAFENLLAELKASYGIDPESLHSYEDWNTWYEDQRGKVNSALS